MNKKWKSSKCPNQGELEICGDLFLCVKCTKRCEQWRTQPCNIEKNITIAEMTPIDPNGAINCVNSAFLDYGDCKDFAGLCKKYGLTQVESTETADKGVAYWTATQENWLNLLLKSRSYLLAVYCHFTGDIAKQAKKIFENLNKQTWAKLIARDRDYLSDYLQFRNMDVQLENEDWFFICKKQPQLIYAAQQNGQYFSLPEMTEFIALHPTFNAKLYAQIIELIKKQPAAARGELWCSLLIGTDRKNGKYRKENWENCQFQDLTGKDWKVLLSKPNLERYAIETLKKYNLTKNFTDADWQGVMPWKKELPAPSFLNFYKFYQTAPRTASKAQRNTLLCFMPIFFFAVMVLATFFTHNDGLLRNPCFYLYGVAASIFGAFAFSGMPVSNRGMFANSILWAATGALVLPMLLFMGLAFKGYCELDGVKIVGILLPLVLVVLVPVMLCSRMKMLIYSIFAVIWLITGYFVFMDGMYHLNDKTYLNLSKQARTLKMNGFETRYLQKHLAKTEFQKRWNEACVKKNTNDLHGLLEEWTPVPEVGDKLYKEYLGSFIDAWLAAEGENKGEFQKIYVKNFMRKEPETQDENKNPDVAKELLCEKIAGLGANVWENTIDYYDLYGKIPDPKLIPSETYESYLKNLFREWVKNKDGVNQELKKEIAETKYKDDKDGKDVFVDYICGKDVKTAKDLQKYVEYYKNLTDSVPENLQDKVCNTLAEGNLEVLKNDFEKLSRFIPKSDKKAKSDKRASLVKKLEGKLRDYEKFDLLKKIHEFSPISDEYWEAWCKGDGLYNNYANNTENLENLLGETLFAHIKESYDKFYAESVIGKYNEALKELYENKYELMKDFASKYKSDEAEKNFWFGYAYYLADTPDDRKTASEYWKRGKCFEAILSSGFIDSKIKERIKPEMLRAFAEQLYAKQESSKKGKEVLEKCLTIDESKEETYKLLLQNEDLTTYFVEAALDDDLKSKEFLKSYKITELNLKKDVDVLDALLVVYADNTEVLFKKVKDSNKLTELHSIAISKKHEKMRKKLGHFYCTHENWDANQKNWVAAAREIWDSFDSDTKRAKVIEEELSDKKDKFGEIYYRLSPAAGINIDKLRNEFNKNYWEDDGGAPPEIPVDVANFYLQKAIAHEYPEALYLNAMKSYIDYVDNKKTAAQAEDDLEKAKEKLGNHQLGEAITEFLRKWKSQ